MAAAAWRACALGLALGAAGCGGSPVTPDPDGGTSRTSVIPAESPQIRVGGEAAILPPAATWLVAQGQREPVLEGLRVRVEEPLHRVLEDCRASFGEATLGSAPTFEFGSVPTSELVLGLAVGIEEAEGGAGALAPVSTVIYDTTREGRRPQRDLMTVRAWALPTTWLERLEKVVGPAALAVWAPAAASLAEAGFVVGQVVDATGQPMAGLRLRISPEELAPRLTYPSAGLTKAAGVATDAEGLFLLVHDGGDMRTFTLTVDGREDVPTHSGTLARGAGLLLRVFPPP